MSIFLAALIALGVGIGGWNICADLLKIPHKITQKSMIAAAAISSMSDDEQSVFIKNLANFISRFVRINPYNREMMAEKLRIGRIAMPPEEYLANALVKPVIAGIAGIILMLLSPLAGLIHPVIRIMVVVTSVAVVIIGILYYVRDLQLLDENIKIKREKIESELPRFVSVISKRIVRDNNILSILEQYQKSAGEELAHELKITIADMKSGNEETALMRLESRVNSSAMSDTVRGLIATIRGDATQTYWENLEIKFSEMARQQLEKQTLIIPGKISKLTGILAGCFIATYFVIFGVVIIEGFSKF